MTKILIVDDEADVLELYVELLSLEGFDVLATSDPEKARALMTADEEVGLLICDIRMPSISGLALAESVRQERGEGRPLATIFVSGDVAIIERGLPDWAVGIRKPIDPDELTKAIRSIVAG